MFGVLHGPVLAFQLDHLVLQVPVLNFQVFADALEVLCSLAVLILPLLSEFLLRDQDVVGSLFVLLVSLLHFEHLFFQVRTPRIGLILHVMHSVRMECSGFGQLRHKRILLLSQLHHQLFLSFVLTEQSVIFPGQQVDLDLVFMQFDLCFLALLGQVLFRISQAFQFAFELRNSALRHLLLLRNLLIVRLVLARCVVFERTQLLVKLQKFSGLGLKFKAHFGLRILGIGQEALEVGVFVSLLVHLVLVLRTELVQDAVMSLVQLLRLGLNLSLKSRDAVQKLLFFQQDTVSFQVCVLDSLLAFKSEKGDLFLLFLVNGNLLLLIFE